MPLTEAQRKRRDKLRQQVEEMDEADKVEEEEKEDWMVTIEENGRKITMPYSKAKHLLAKMGYDLSEDSPDDGEDEEDLDEDEDGDDGEDEDPEEDLDDGEDAPIEQPKRKRTSERYFRK